MPESDAFLPSPVHSLNISIDPHTCPEIEAAYQVACRKWYHMNRLQQHDAVLIHLAEVDYETCQFWQGVCNLAMAGAVIIEESSFVPGLGYLIYEFTTNRTAGFELASLAFTSTIPNITWVDDTDTVVATGLNFSGYNFSLHNNAPGNKHFRCFTDAYQPLRRVSHRNSPHLVDITIYPHICEEHQIQSNSNLAAIGGSSYYGEHLNIVRYENQSLPLAEQERILQAIIDQTPNPRTDNPTVDIGGNPDNNLVSVALITELTNKGWSYR
jgi:hypothetical protein